MANSSKVFGPNDWLNAWVLTSFSGGMKHVWKSMERFTKSPLLDDKRTGSARNHKISFLLSIHSVAQGKALMVLIWQWILVGERIKIKIIPKGPGLEAVTLGRGRGLGKSSKNSLKYATLYMFVYLRFSRDFCHLCDAFQYRIQQQHRVFGAIRIRLYKAL